MHLHRIVATSRAVAATRSRKKKSVLLAETLREADPDHVALVAGYLSGRLRQRRTGLGWRSLADLPEPADQSTLTAVEVDAALECISALAGSGSRATRTAAVAGLFGRATGEEQAWLRAVITGEVRQGALDAALLEAVAAAASVPLALVRRAAMLAGSPVEIAVLALGGGAEALEAVGLEVGRPVLPMLASSAPNVEAALEKVGGRAIVDAKLDGIRIQVHKDGDEVLLATRTLDDITGRLPEVVELVRGLPARAAVLDGEVLLAGPDGRPRPFQETAARTATAESPEARVTAYFFDLLHLDGTDLIDTSLTERRAALRGVVPESQLVASTETDSAEAATAFTERMLAAGQEGVVVKSPGAGYEAGRRGAGWVKVKPVHTVDLVVLAVEEGSGRRRGWLSNIHLGARDPDGDGFVMVGKTFKGMTDAMLAWQTERFTELMTRRDSYVVHVRPEQVVEIAFDGVQRSTRYPGGVALRFARVVRYREDKRADEADTIDSVRSLLATPSA